MRISIPHLLSAFSLGVLFSLFTLSAAAQTNLGSVNVGSSATTAVTVTLPSGGTLGTVSVVTQGEPNLDFTDAGGDTCATGTLYAANATCTVNVTFKPRFAGVRYGAVVLANSTGILATEYLQGLGLGPQVTFQPATQSNLFTSAGASVEAWGATADGNGNLYLDTYSNQIVKETPLSSGYIQSLVADVVNQYSFFSSMTVDGAGNVIFNNQADSSIVKESLNAGVYTSSTIYSYDQSSFTDYAADVAVDGSGNVFILDPIGNLIEEKPTGNTYSQSIILSGFPSYDCGIAVDGHDNIYVTIVPAPNPGQGIMELSPSSTGYTYSYIFPNLPAVYTVFVDGLGNIYFSNSYQTFEEFLSGSYNQKIIDSAGYLTTADGAGNLFSAGGPSIVEKIDNADPPSLSFAPTVKGATSTDSPQTVTVTNFGNEPLNITAVAYPSDFPEAAGTVGDCVPGISLAVNGACTLTIDFTPIAAPGSTTPNNLSESVSITTNTLNTTATQQNIAVSGLESINQPAPAPVLSLPSGNYTSQDFTVNASDAVQGATIYYTVSNDYYGSSPIPTTSSSVYSAKYPIDVSFSGVSSITVEAMATAPGYLVNSPVTTATYTYSDFIINVSPSSLSGASGTATVTITPANSNGFPYPVNFSCSAPPAQGSSCSFSPGTVTPGNATVSSTMTLTAASSSSKLHRDHGPLFSGAVLALTLCSFGWRKRRNLRILLLIAISIAGMSLINGCGFVCSYCDEKQKTAPETYTINVIGTSGSDSHSAVFSYVVNLPTS
jgi:hypothetical protein